MPLTELKPCVIVVEDEFLIRMLAVETLSDAGLSSHAIGCRLARQSPWQ